MDTARQIGQALVFLTINLVTGMVALCLVVAGVAVSLGLIPTVVGGLGAANLTLSGCRGAGRLQRSHLELVTGRRIPPPEPVAPRSGFWGRLTASLGDGPSWRAFAFWWVEPIVAVVSFFLVFTLIPAGLVGIIVPFGAHRMSGLAAELGLLGRLWFLVGGLLALPAGLAGSVLAVRVHQELARLLLGRPRTAELQERVTDLDTARSAALDAAETERRRIERDLHDGTQQRLVALALDLGMAREKMQTDPDAARRLVADAHDEVKETMAELRSLTRGLRPSVLEDRGLDAALSAVAARCPFPVDIRVDLERRPPATVESTAYFLVSEALTNATRHASATRAGVAVHLDGPALVVVVTDDGRGDARIVPGGGLQGLADRVAGFEGTLTVHSPPGGPTVIRGELPCGS